MTYARAHLVVAENGGVYLCTSRCVRRAWLCGEDPLTGRDLGHRKAWIEQRLLGLCRLFAIDLLGYAVMSNHYHCVLRVDPQRSREWTNAQVAERWSRLRASKDEADRLAKVESLLADRQALGRARARLGSLSCFMACVNEPIARRSNREDGCTGRFWQGRFDSRALLDAAATIGAMVYTDMNPVRAKQSTDATASAYTSIAQRMADSASTAKPKLAPLSVVGLNLRDYTALLKWTTDVYHGNNSAPDGPAATALARLSTAPDRWLARVTAHRHKYRAYGTLSALRVYVASLGQCWIRGMKQLA